MRTTFRIHYLTSPGEEVRVVLAGTAHRLEWAGAGWWADTIPSYRGAPYHYRIVAEGAVVAEETGGGRRTPAAPGDAVTVVDRWREPDPARRTRESALFRRALASSHPPAVNGPPRGVTFRVLSPGIAAGRRPAIVGSTPELGTWDPAHALPLDPGPYPWWRASVETAGEPAEYKYVVLDEAGDVAMWEHGPNRALPETSEPTVVTDDEIRGVDDWRGGGVSVPVFSLRTQRSVGVGQYTDIIPFVDWAAATGLRIVQLLPVNDTTRSHGWDDSYPYDVVSVRALHPMYIDLEDLGSPEVLGEVEAARSALESLPEMAYERVMDVKWTILRQVYGHVADGLDDDADFAEFVDREWDWLGPYSMWSVLRDTHLTPQHAEWGPDRSLDQARLDAMTAPDSDTKRDLQFHWWVQHHLHRQLQTAADHARSRGVALKGDLPIGVSPTSVETWASPELFHLGAQAGAPPDAFAVRGQNWGFPTYDWNEMAGDGYAWWKARFTAMARSFDVYRIDHVLGFFRIWEIPPDALDGLLGTLRPCRPLSGEEVASQLGDVDIDALTRPAVDVRLLEARFGRRAGTLRERFFTGPDDNLAFAPGLDTQRRLVEAIDAGALDGLPIDERPGISRTLLDIAADVLLLDVGGGYHPRISWAGTERYRRMSPDRQAAFDELAEDFFYHRHDDEWEEEGRRRLPAIVEATDMLPCGEDLGMVPVMVPVVMNDLGLLSLEIERMPKVLGAWMADPGAAPYLSVVSPGTHDTSPLREWWREDPATTSRYWHEALGRLGDPPAEASPEIIEAIVHRHLVSPAMLCIVPLADLLGMDAELHRTDGLTERINEPSDRYHRWRYRMHVTVEDLAKATDFNERLRSMLSASGR